MTFLVAIIAAILILAHLDLVVAVLGAALVVVGIVVGVVLIFDFLASLGSTVVVTLILAAIVATALWLIVKGRRKWKEKRIEVAQQRRALKWYQPVSPKEMEEERQHLLRDLARDGDPDAQEQLRALEAQERAEREARDLEWRRYCEADAQKQKERHEQEKERRKARLKELNERLRKP